MYRMTDGQDGIQFDRSLKAKTVEPFTDFVHKTGGTSPACVAASHSALASVKWNERMGAPTP